MCLKFFFAVERKFHGWFKKVLSMLLRSFLAVSSNGVSRVFQGYLKSDSGKFQKVLRKSGFKFQV